MINITDNIREVIAKIRDIPHAANRAGTKTFKEATSTIARIMRRPGLPIRYPVQWDSERQRRYVIAKLKREGNLPYQRENNYVNAWETVSIPNGEIVQNLGQVASLIAGVASGEFSGAVHVLPTGQSHIHAGRWRLVRPVVEAVLSRLPRNIIEALGIEVNQ